MPSSLIIKKFELRMCKSIAKTIVQNWYIYTCPNLDTLTHKGKILVLNLLTLEATKSFSEIENMVHLWSIKLQCIIFNSSCLIWGCWYHSSTSIHLVLLFQKRSIDE